MHRDDERVKTPHAARGARVGCETRSTPAAELALEASVAPDARVLIDLATMRMPFGRYRGCALIDLPEPYVVWFRQHGFPRGRLGQLLATLYEVKANGLEHLVRELRSHLP